MTIFRLIFFAFIYCIFFIAIQSVFKTFGVSTALIPDFIVIFILFIAFYELSPFGALLAFIVGLTVDVSGGILIGPWAASYVLCFGIFAIIAERMFVDAWVTVLPFAFFIVLASHFLYLLIIYDPLGQLATEWYRLAGKALVTALVSPILMYFMKWFFQIGVIDRGNYRSYSKY